MSLEKKEVKFTIGKSGQINMEVVGMTGEGCANVTQELELHLSRAGKKVDEGKKPEFYEPDNTLSTFNDLTGGLGNNDY